MPGIKRTGVGESAYSVTPGIRAVAPGVFIVRTIGLDHKEN
jgi:hypothetical protein